MGISIAVDLSIEEVKSKQGTAPRPGSSIARFKKVIEGKQASDAQAFLDSECSGRMVAMFGRKETIFAQGDPAKNVMYIQKGVVKLSVVNEAGKEAVIEVLGSGDFLGVKCLAGRPDYMATAVAIVPTTVLVIEKNDAIRLLHQERAFSNRFIAYILTRNVRAEETLKDQLLNSSEERLAHTLLLLADYGTPGHPQAVLSNVSQEDLAEMVGTTRSRVSLFMNRFRTMGFIEYGGRLEGPRINKPLLSAFLQA
jgi:CRP/FNR family transcriptional regulator, cyclic AMP receptor protein